MALYKESVLNGTSYRRAVRVIMENDLDKPPRVLYIEQDVWVVGNTVSQMFVNPIPLGGVVDPNGTIALRDTTTKELTGQTVSAGLVYAALYSDYINRAMARDAEEAAALANSVSTSAVTMDVTAPDVVVVTN